MRASGSHQQYRALATAVSRGRLSARWDSDSFPPGSYEFRVSGFDAAGNRTSSGLRGDGRPMVLTNPIKTTTSLAFAFGGRHSLWSHCQRMAGGRRAPPPDDRVAAAATGDEAGPVRAGDPGGRRLDLRRRRAPGRAERRVVESFPAGAASATRTNAVQTGADGFLFAHLAAGPSPRVELRFPGARF